MPNPFAHHIPGATAALEMTMLREKFAELATLIGQCAGGPSRERSLALTKLEEASFWANKACVKSDPESVPEA